MSVSPPLHIGAILRNARAFNMQNWRGGVASMDDILPIVAELFALFKQRKIRPVLVGGIALLQYIQGRNTEDIDLILAVSSLKKLPEIEIISEDMYFARGQFKGLQIDFLLTRNPLFARVRQAYTMSQQFLEQEIVSATVAGLVLLKLYTLPSLYGQENFARAGLYENDIATLLYYHQPDMMVIQQELAKHLSSSDLGAIGETLEEINKRISRFQRSTDAAD